MFIALGLLFSVRVFSCVEFNAMWITCTTSTRHFGSFRNRVPFSQVSSESGVSQQFVLRRAHARARRTPVTTAHALATAPNYMHQYRVDVHSSELDQAFGRAERGDEAVLFTRLQLEVGRVDP